MSLASGPSAVIVDASVTIEAVTGQSPWPERWSDWARSDAMLLAPSHFRAEIANGLLKGAGAAQGRVGDRLRTVMGSGVDVTDRGWRGVLHALELAERHRLTLYDALYLQLAVDVDAPLATLDRALAAAARAEGIEVID